MQPRVWGGGRTLGVSHGLRGGGSRETRAYEKLSNNVDRVNRDDDNMCYGFERRY